MTNSKWSEIVASFRSSVFLISNKQAKVFQKERKKWIDFCECIECDLNLQNSFSGRTWTENTTGSLQK